MASGVSGLISGLDTESIITKTMAIERRPIQLLQQQEAAYKAKISAFGSLKGVLADLQTAAAALKDPSTFAGFSASSGNTTILDATASSTAVTGTYRVTVSTLAQAQQVRSSAFTASTDVVGTGTLTIQVGTNAAVNVTIDSTNNTLAGIAQAINNSTADVTAGVVNDGLGHYYLTMASKKTGASNTISVTMADADGINTDANGLSKLYNNPAAQTMFETQPAGNAQISVNGIATERASNTAINDLLTGVTLNLKKADPLSSFDVTVSRDVGTVSSKVQNFVDKYNTALTTLKQMQISSPETGQIGALQGDSTPRILQSRLQSLLFAKVDGVASSVNGLSSLGVTADKDGKLSFDSTAFTSAYTANRGDVVNFFTQTTAGSEGVALQFNDLLDSYLNSSSGLLAAKTDGLNSSVTRIEDQVASINTRLAKREENMRKQFNALESLLSQFQNTSGVLTQQLTALSNLNAQISNKK